MLPDIAPTQGRMSKDLAGPVGTQKPTKKPA